MIEDVNNIQIWWRSAEDDEALVVKDSCKKSKNSAALVSAAITLPYWLCKKG